MSNLSGKDVTRILLIGKMKASSGGVEKVRNMKSKVKGRRNELEGVAKAGAL